MATDAQIRANRINAQRSTGARTHEGKQRSKFNALKHGLTSVHVVLPWEEDILYQELRGELFRQYQPENTTESFLVDQLAQNWWRLNRARRVETGTLASLGPESHVTGPTNVDLDHLRRYESAIERAFYRAYDRIERITRTRPRQTEQTTPVDPIGFVSQSTTTAVPADVNSTTTAVPLDLNSSSTGLLACEPSTTTGLLAGRDPIYNGRPDPLRTIEEHD